MKNNTPQEALVNALSRLIKAERQEQTARVINADRAAARTEAARRNWRRAVEALHASK